MATVKIKFRPSTVDGGQGTIFYQVIHNRVARQQKTGYRLYGYEWNSHLTEVVLPRFNDERKRYLSEISDKIHMDVKSFQKIISGFEHSGCDYTADDVMDTDMMMAYEAYLKRSGVSPNSSSFYMRNLRAVYNRAVEKELTTQRYPFKHVYTGVEKTLKRAVPLKTIKQIKEMDLSMNPTLGFARDMFLFSFYTRGMSFVDMAYLRKKDLNGNILSYRRRKTGQQLFIKWEMCMQEIVDKYDNPLSQYLLPIIKPLSEIDERKQYIYTAHNINRSLKVIGNQLGLSVSLTMYVSRHAWASIAKSKNVPISVISEGMGHDSEATTRIYLASLDTMAIDKANSMILKSL